MSISPAHSAAARENGAKSQGPVTDEGKARSAQNARKLGIFGPILLRNSKDEENYYELLNGYLLEYRPETVFENRCVREMVDAEWRLAILRESVNLMQLNHVRQAPDGFTAPQAWAHAFQTMADSGNALALALRYEKHFQRQYEKSHQALIQSRRQQALDRKLIAQRTDQAMAGILQAIVDTPPPGAHNLYERMKQNEPKPPAPNPQNPPFNPTQISKPVPQSSIPNLYKG